MFLLKVYKMLIAWLPLDEGIIILILLILAIILGVNNYKDQASLSQQEKTNFKLTASSQAVENDYLTLKNQKVR